MSHNFHLISSFLLVLMDENQSDFFTEQSEKLFTDHELLQGNFK